jgi:hypothetical protein
MTREEALKLMLDSINQDNIDLATRSNLDKDQIDKFVQESQMTLQYVTANLYDRMKSAGLIKD